MRLALYHPWVYLTSGIERSFVEILRRSRHEWTIYTHRFDPDTTYPELSRAPVVELEPRVSVRRSLLPLLAAARTIGTTRLPQRGEQGLLVSSEGLGDFVLARATVPAVCFCHTPLKILHDPVTSARLRAASPPKWLASRALAPVFTAADRRMWRRYRHVLANSEETRRRIGRARLWPAESVEVLHPGVDVSAFAGDPASPPGDLFLVAGRIMWQKNIELAIEAFRLFLTRCQEPANMQLIVAGAVDEKSRPYLAELTERARGLPISFEPDPPDARLRELYRTARALVYTPPNEDWGMVPLEAMASATPVIAVDGGGPRESIEPGSGWLLPPTADAFAEQMARVVAMPIPQLRTIRQAALARAHRYGWEAFVQRLDEVMEQSVQPPRAAATES